MKNKNFKLKTILLASGALVASAIVSAVIINSSSHNTSLIQSKNSSNVFIQFATTYEGVEWEGPKIVKARKGDFFGSILAPNAFKNGRPYTYWTTTEGDTTTKISSTTIINQNMTLYPYFENDIDLKKCVGVTALQDSAVSLQKHGELSNLDLTYTIDGKEWKEVTTDEPIKVASGTTVYFKGNNKNGFSKDIWNYATINISGCANLNGNIMALIDDGRGELKTIPNNYCFYSLFRNSSGIFSISSSLLGATTLTQYCYQYMFAECDNLSAFPKNLLPANKLSTGCYSHMFYNCSGIKSIPQTLLHVNNKVSGDQLAPYCYEYMFRGCNSITSLPNVILPSINLTDAEGCYQGMFRECNGLTSISNDFLPATTLSKNCYRQMFSHSVSITDISSLSLKNINLSEGCYQEMFWGCTGITKAPTTVCYGTSRYTTQKLAKNCCNAMFYGCSNLTTLPILNSYSLAEQCYAYMFWGCTSLTTSSFPNSNYLPASSLQVGCYLEMFSRAFNENAGADEKKVNGKINLTATTLPDYCYQSMFSNAHIIDTAALPSTEITASGTSCCNSMYANSDIMTSTGFTTSQTLCGNNSFNSMYYSCVNLTAPGYTYITYAGYRSCFFMYANCTSLTLNITSLSSQGTRFFCCGDGNGAATDTIGWAFQDCNIVDPEYPGILTNSQYNWVYTYN